MPFISKDLAVLMKVLNYNYDMQNLMQYFKTKWKATDYIDQLKKKALTIKQVAKSLETDANELAGQTEGKSGSLMAQLITNSEDSVKNLQSWTTLKHKLQTEPITDSIKYYIYNFAIDILCFHTLFWMNLDFDVIRICINIFTANVVLNRVWSAI